MPEGIIFQSQNAYKQLRKLLVEEYLVAVVSLPAGVFNPYSGVKTSILILDKAMAKKTDRIAFFKVENDGFDLGAQRRPIEKSDLPQVRAELVEYLGRLRAGNSWEDSLPTIGLVVEKGRVNLEGEYTLIGERFLDVEASSSSYPLARVGHFYRKNVKSLDPRLKPDDNFELWSIPAFDRGSPEILRGSQIGSHKKLVYPGDVLLSRIIPHIRRSWVVQESANDYCKVASTEWIVFSSNDTIPEFLQRMITSNSFHGKFMQTVTGVGGSLSRANQKAVADILIPLPPLEVQQEIVAEIEGYQKVIDGARAVIDNYRPHIPIDPDWPLVELGKVCNFKRGPFGGSLKKEIFVRDGYAIYEQSHAISGEFSSFRYFITEKKYCEMQGFEVHPRDIIMSCSGTMGRTAIVPDYAPPGIINQALLRLGTSDRILAPFLKLWMDSSNFQRSIEEITFGAAIRNVASVKVLKSLKIPLPSLESQQAIVAEIRAEQALVNANRELIKRMDDKIESSIAHVWGNP